MNAGPCFDIGIFGAEPWTEAMRHDIEVRSAIDAVDIYGLSEVMGPGVANECIEAKDGPVIWEDHFYPEIIDPETGVPAADGEEGELVFPTQIEELVLKHGQLSGQYQLVITRQGKLDAMQVLCELAPQHGGADRAA